ncbi:MAG TPA: hypothetical protein VGB45_11425 [Abditibacterium sp.]|jgi:hypothetical protein
MFTALNEKTAPRWGRIVATGAAPAPSADQNTWPAGAARLASATAQSARSAAALFHPVSFHFTPMFFLV